MERKQLEVCEQLLRMKPVYDRLCEIASSQLLQAAESGEYSLQYHKVTRGKRSRVWAADADALTAAFGEAVYTSPKPELLSVAAAEAKLGKSEIQPYFKWVEGGNKLAPMSSILSEVTMNCSEFD